ncbi:MAG: hypothetical protein E7673_04980 [Ruminococcaceae bacterium]|nr:hypothetical protein [Oscillospiraceae bacterium]
MTVESLAKECGFEVICMPSPERVPEGAYIGDLLSWVMGKADSGNVWITIMSNINVIAVATLTDVSCVVLAEGVTIDAEIIAAAEAKGVNVLSSSNSAYAIAKQISGII